MAIRVHYKYMLTLPHVRVDIQIGDRPRALDCTARDRGDGDLTAHPNWPNVQERLAHRDWRELRERFVNLDLSDSAVAKLEVAVWLNDVGYIPVVRDANGGVESMQLDWKPEYITPEIVSWLRSRRDVVSWLMRMEHDKFRQAIGACWDYVEDQRDCRGAHAEAAYQGKRPPKLKPPVEEFVRSLSAPRDLNPKVLEEFLIGAGVAPNLAALFHWDREGNPSVTVHVGSPLEAIGLSIHIDRNFSARRWVVCAKCGNGFEQKKGSDRFCSDRCRNYFNTNKRRRKIRLLHEAAKSWEVMPAKHKRCDRLEWIAAWIERKTKGEIEVELGWVARQLRNMRPRRSEAMRMRRGKAPS